MNAGLLQFLFYFRQVCEKFNEMMPNNIRTMRMSKEILDLTRNPPHGVTCWAKNDRNDLLEAIVQGSEDTPYANGSFRIDIVIPDRYPMDPPQLKFLTKVYHPNIDNVTGLICLDVLKMPPQGRWRPVNNLSLILTAVKQLLSDPNPHDPLDSAIAQEYIANKSLFTENAKKWTQLYAMDNSTTRPPKRKSMEEPNCDEKSKRLCPSSESESSKNEQPQSEDPTVSTSESSSKIPSKRKRAIDPDCGESSKRSNNLRLEDDSISEKQDKNSNTINNSRSKV